MNQQGRSEKGKENIREGERESDMVKERHGTCE